MRDARSLIPGDTSFEFSKAGILTPGSTSAPHLPNPIGQWYTQPSSPVTAAGPFLICTGFPLMSFDTLWKQTTAFLQRGQMIYTLITRHQVIGRLEKNSPRPTDWPVILLRPALLPFAERPADFQAGFSHTIVEPRALGQHGNAALRASTCICSAIAGDKKILPPAPVPEPKMLVGKPKEK